MELPGHATGDGQRSVEYVVAAIRAVSARAHRRIAVVGHSQGALLATFAEPPVRCALVDECGSARLRPSLSLRRVKVSSERIATVAGAVVLPEGATHQCTGDIAVRIGRRVTSASLAPTCRFSLLLTRSRRARRAIVAFSGDRWLQPVRRRIRLAALSISKEDNQ